MKHILKKRNIIFVIIVFIITIYFMLKNNYIHKEMFKNLNYFYLLIGILISFGVWVSEILMLKSILHKDISIHDSFENIALGQLFNGLTPFASGGQVVQIYHMNSKKVAYAKSTATLFIMFFIYQIILTILGIISIFFKYSYFKVVLKEKIYFIFFGFTLNLIIAIFLISLFFISKNSGRFMFGVIKKIPFLKEKYKNKLYIKIRKFIKEFYLSINIIKNDKKIVVKLIVLNLIKLFCMYIMPYFIILSLKENIKLEILLPGMAFLNMITSFIPLPGASLGAEGGFILIFHKFLLQKNIFFIMFLWRVLSYYLNILVGSLIMIYIILKEEKEIKNFIK
ncbi:uncharacterized protein (TIRG00374 family) [Hypnocyclicus thermotrophus]|uniref:Uncharacterized protein (TIRG00374 family) n=1 Tax=Hypnocyclicus thermotrophus TaxID=1627895 RepID=A0AA46DXK0_9FUSO|nr:lysylphosphatidylglycerol synthase transmembrane domain-containing protein [Hypnocyclicus thermotrophus]TDT68520.1 uncharacterized protein (TIRG00374 family) [Hypnocyclicus thermotrophus]